jgi:hypothetical protein
MPKRSNILNSVSKYLNNTQVQKITVSKNNRQNFPSTHLGKTKSPFRLCLEIHFIFLFTHFPVFYNFLGGIQ